jgi:riboflavin synthase
MFTGLVENTAKIVSLHPSFTIKIVRGFSDLSGLKTGDSVAVNGCCLTLLNDVIADRIMRFDLNPETLQKTTFHLLTPDSVVNIERAMTLQSRLGGHMVTGHVDGIAEVTSVRPDGNCIEISVSIPGQYRKHFIEKGSICLDGISLTVNAVIDQPHDIIAKMMIIPHTLSETTLKQVRVGQKMNFETDIIGKYVARSLEK